MNLDQYYNLYNYLDTETIPTDFTTYQRKQLQNQAKYFEIKDKLLYKRNKKNPDKQTPSSCKMDRSRPSTLYDI